MSVTKKLYKKIAYVLAVALVVTMIPQTSFATGADNDAGTVKLTGVKAVEMYSKFDESAGKIVSDYVPVPRELDDYHLLNTYGLANVPYGVSELRLNGDEFANGTFDDLSKAVADEVCDGLKKSQAVFFTGADGDTAIGVAAGVRRAFPEGKVGMISLDGAGNIDSIAAIMGSAENTAWTKAAGENAAAYDALLFTDGRDLAEGSDATLAAVDALDSYYAKVDTDEFKDKDTWGKAVADLADKVDAIYLHIDADFLHQGYISHMDTAAGEGPDIWVMMDNLKTVMDTGKVAAVNLASTYTADPGYTQQVASEELLGADPFSKTKLTSVWTARGYMMPQYHTWETEEELVNRLSLMTIRSAVRMVSTVFGNWASMPVVPDAAVVVPDAANAKTGNMKDLKVVEILTRTVEDGIFVGRNDVDPNKDGSYTGGAYTYEQRGTVKPGKDSISPYIFPRPREIDDFALAGIYDLAGVPKEVVQVDITNEESDEKYPEMTRYEGYNRDVSNEVYEGLMDGKAVLLDAMGCVPCVGIGGGMRRAFGDDAKLGIIYIDAHGDINTLDSTYSGGIGGVCLAPVVGVDEHPTAQNWWNTSSDSMKPFDELFHCSANNLDSGVDTYDKENPYEFGEAINILRAVSDEEFYMSTEDFQNPKYFGKVLEDFADRVDAIYLHIDMDFLDNSQTMNSGSADCGYYTGRPGPDIWKTMKNVESIMATDKVAVFHLASTTSNANAGYVDDGRMARRGYAYPAVAGEEKRMEDGITAEDRVVYTNRTSSAGILQGMRILGSALGNWNNCAMPEAKVEPAAPVDANSVKADTKNGLTLTVNTSAEGTADIVNVKKTTKKTITIPSTVTVNGINYDVTAINGKAFKNCSKATKIVVPASITLIKKNAFAGVEKLKTIEFKTTKNSITMKKGAYKGVKKSVVAKVPEKMKAAQYKKFAKAIKAAGFKGKVKKG